MRSTASIALTWVIVPIVVAALGCVFLECWFAGFVYNDEGRFSLSFDQYLDTASSIILGLALFGAAEYFVKSKRARIDAIADALSTFKSNVDKVYSLVSVSLNPVTRNRDSHLRALSDAGIAMEYISLTIAHLKEEGQQEILTLVQPILDKFQDLERCMWDFHGNIDDDQGAWDDYYIDVTSRYRSLLKVYTKAQLKLQDL